MKAPDDGRPLYETYQKTFTLKDGKTETRTYLRATSWAREEYFKWMRELKKENEK